VANVALVLLVVLFSWYLGSIVRRRGRGIVARRGTGVGADLGALADQPRVRVRAVTKTGPDKVRLVLSPEPDPSAAPAVARMETLRELARDGDAARQLDRSTPVD
jgi:hypothetical protein